MKCRGTCSTLLVTTPPVSLSTESCWVSPILPTIDSSLSPSVASTPNEGTPPPPNILRAEHPVNVRKEEKKITFKNLYTKRSFLGIILRSSLISVNIHSLFNINTSLINLCLKVSTYNPVSIIRKNHIPIIIQILNFCFLSHTLHIYLRDLIHRVH